MNGTANKRRIDAFSRSAQMLMSTAKQNKEIMHMEKWQILSKYLLVYDRKPQQLMLMTFVQSKNAKPS